MAPTKNIRTPPKVESYIPLSQHQSQTPEVFFNGKPVLHYHTTGATASIHESQRGLLPFFPADTAAATDGAEAEDAPASSENLTCQVDVFASTEDLTIFCPEAECGIVIPYTAIVLSAVQHEGEGDEKRHFVWVQAELSDSAIDMEGECIDLQLSLTTPTPDTPTETTTTTTQSKAESEKLYEAISYCSNLHPDPHAEDDEDDEDAYFDRIVFEGGEAVAGLEGDAWILSGGVDSDGLPPPMPGGGQWITAGNINEFFDADGNWIAADDDNNVVDDDDDEAEAKPAEDAEAEKAPETSELGSGAGRVRARDEIEPVQNGASEHAAAATANGDGASEQASESKRQRIE